MVYIYFILIERQVKYYLNNIDNLSSKSYDDWQLTMPDIYKKFN